MHLNGCCADHIGLSEVEFGKERLDNVTLGVDVFVRGFWQVLIKALAFGPSHLWFCTKFT
jgi:hypothetical protein